MTCLAITGQFPAEAAVTEATSFAMRSYLDFEKPVAELEAKVAALTNNISVAQEKAFAAWLQQPVDKKGKLPADLAPLADPAKTPTAKERNKLRQHYVAKVWPEESKQLPETKAFAAARDARDEIGRAHV